MTKKYFNQLPADTRPDDVDYYKAVNWNNLEDLVDKLTYEKLTSQFWLSTRVPVSNDIDDWRTMTPMERDIVDKVLMGLTMLDTLQSEEGAVVLLPDARTQHEKSVLSNIHFMECYTSDHQLLTKDGWKPISKIKVGDEVLAYSKDSNSTQFEPVLQTSSHIADDIYHIYNKKGGVNLKVSSGHRMYFEEKVSKTNHGENIWNSCIVEAKDFVNLPKTAFRRLRHNTPNFVADLQKSELTPVQKLLIAFQADGCLVKREKIRLDAINDGFTNGMVDPETAHVKFSVKKSRKVDRLKYLLKESGLTHTISENQETGYTDLFVKIPIGLIDKNKELKNMFSLDDFNASSALDFIEEVARWDSHDARKANKGGKYVTYYSSSKSNVDFVSAVATIAGLPVRQGHRTDERSDNFSESHFVRISFNKTSLYTTLQSIKSELLPPEMVYGVEVPSSLLVVNNGDKPIISGNCEHARSYSTIFSSLNNTARIDELFQWGNNNEMLQYKAKKINEIYQDGTPLQKKVASVFLESFLFYSGFYTPLRFLGSNKIPNVAEIIKLILRDESVHGTYLGYKFQLGFDELPKEEQEELKNWTYDLLFDLYDNESKYTHLIYDEIGWDADVLTFIRYNANKALQNLGFDPLFPDTAEDVNPIVMNGISTGTSNHDFFSQVGNGYLMGEVEAMDDSDYADWM